MWVGTTLLGGDALHEPYVISHLEVWTESAAVAFLWAFNDEGEGWRDWFPQSIFLSLRDRWHGPSGRV